MSDTSRRRWLGLIPAAAAVPLYSQTPPPGSGYRTHNILDYGAKGDGQTLDTTAVQAAIDACHGDRGGVVLVPAGDFLVGTLQLKSYVTLHLSPSGRLLGSGKSTDYTAGKGVPPGNGNVVLLYAVNAENVTIEGGGNHRRARPAILYRQGRQHRPRGQCRRRLPGAAAPGDLLPLPQRAGARRLFDAQRVPLRAPAGMPLCPPGRGAHPQPGQPEQRRISY